MSEAGKIDEMKIGKIEGPRANLTIEVFSGTTEEKIGESPTG